MTDYWETLERFLSQYERERYDTGFEYVKPEEADAIREALAEVERLKADKRQSIEINAKLSSRVSAALAEAEDTNTPDDYRKLQRVVEALTGGRE